jgi:hypothetical protein
MRICGTPASLDSAGIKTRSRWDENRRPRTSQVLNTGDRCQIVRLFLDLITSQSLSFQPRKLRLTGTRQHAALNPVPVMPHFVRSDAGHQLALSPPQPQAPAGQLLPHRTSNQYLDFAWKPD